MDLQAVAERQQQIAAVVARVDAGRERLAQRLLAGSVDIEDARRRNASMPGRLGKLWAAFIELPATAQAAALREPAFEAMAWQSLLQCSPYFLPRAPRDERRAHERSTGADTMKTAQAPMTLADVEVLLRRASEISNHRRFVVAGSLVATGAVVHPPPEMVMSRDVDFYPQLDPERGFHEIATQLGEGSAFHAEHGFYADPITPAILALPHGWQQRLAPISLAGGVVAFFIDPNDAAIGKLMRGQDNDLRWVRAGIGQGMLDAPTIFERSQHVDRATAQELDALRTNLGRVVENANVRPPLP